MRRIVTLLAVVLMAVAAAPVVPSQGDGGDVRPSVLYTPVEDIDGDGGMDLLEDEAVWRYTSTALEVDSHVLRARSASDLAVLWEWERPERWSDGEGVFNDTYVVRLGESEREGVLILRQETSRTSVDLPDDLPAVPDEKDVTLVTDRAIAIDGGSGRVLWERDIPVLEEASMSAPVVADVLPGATAELLSYRPLGNGVLLQIVDARDGLPGLLHVSSGLAMTDGTDGGVPGTAKLEVVGDVNGDGLDDLLLTTARIDGPTGLDLVSLGSGEPSLLWSRTLSKGQYHAYAPSLLGDVTGDDVPDLLFDRRGLGVTVRGHVVLDGATGEDTLPISEAQDIHFVGDVDGRPGGELALFDRSNGGVDHRTISADGTVSGTTHLTEFLNGGKVFYAVERLGDLDGDGTVELAVNLRTETHSSRHAVVVYRDRHEVLFDGVVKPLGDEGDFLYSRRDGVQRLDGQTREVLWTAPPVQEYNFPFGGAVADVTGDGAGDVILPANGLRIVDGPTGQEILFGPAPVGSTFQVSDWWRRKA